MTDNEEEVVVPELPPMAETDALLAETDSGNQHKKRRIDVKALAAAAMAENNARKRQRAAAAGSSALDAEEEDVSSMAAVAEGIPAAVAEGIPHENRQDAEVESDSTSLYGVTPDPEWLKSFFAFHLFRSLNGPTINPTTKSENSEEKRLATWVNSNRKLLSKVNNGTATNMMKVKVVALQQVSAYEYLFDN